MHFCNQNEENRSLRGAAEKGDVAPRQREELRGLPGVYILLRQKKRLEAFSQEKEVRVFKG